ncbi:hypothetical protein BS47DRAFT_1368033 [Hydnum rufescens UP504]|uniref:Uncharacterized protein n=1 Tax=Hydnum rufescens UP504 TaxID=1448309 RepID=A0A9P6DNR5_9AGAM|nr:hypothetical protein BS47DRAFT_1368033 [Hydnum rufescens UP504]
MLAIASLKKVPKYGQSEAKRDRSTIWCHTPTKAECLDNTHHEIWEHTAAQDPNSQLSATHATMKQVWHHTPASAGVAILGSFSLRETLPKASRNKPPRTPSESQHPTQGPSPQTLTTQTMTDKTRHYTPTWAGVVVCGPSFLCETHPKPAQMGPKAKLDVCNHPNPQPPSTHNVHNNKLNMAPRGNTNVKYGASYPLQWAPFPSVTPHMKPAQMRPEAKYRFKYDTTHPLRQVFSPTIKPHPPGEYIDKAQGDIPACFLLLQNPHAKNAQTRPRQNTGTLHCAISLSMRFKMNTNDHTPAAAGTPVSKPMWTPPSNMAAAHPVAMMQVSASHTVPRDGLGKPNLVTIRNDSEIKAGK